MSPCLRKAIYPVAGNAEKRKARNLNLIKHIEAVLAHIKFLKPHKRHIQLKQDIWIKELEGKQNKTRLTVGKQQNYCLYSRYNLGDVVYQKVPLEN